MGSESVDSEKARQLIAAGEARVIDLRGEEEFGQYHVPGAERVSDPDAEAFAAEAGEQDTVLVFCEDGERSSSLAQELREHGVEAASVEGGMGAWSKEGMPTQPSVDPRREPPAPPTLPGAGT